MSVNRPHLSQTEPVSVQDFEMRVVVNGQEWYVPTFATAKLVHILRDTLNLTGTKLSCGVGRCGACTVLMNGRPVNACMVLAYQADGASITTVEGIDLEDAPVIQAFLDEGAFQCGYCTPGMIMAAKGLLSEYKQPTEEQIRTALTGNLCRCTGYASILRALLSVSKEKPPSV